MILDKFYIFFEKRRFIQDIKVIFRNDPSVKATFLNLLEIVLLYPGLHALWLYRIAHFFYHYRIPLIPRLISQVSRFWTGCDIHPGAKIKGSILIDHPQGVVIGETAEIGDNVIIYSQAVLGNRNGGWDNGFMKKRHPTIGNNVMIGSGAKILGSITVGDYAKVGANSVVLEDVPSYSTAVGVPARIILHKNRGVNLAFS